MGYCFLGEVGSFAYGPLNTACLSFQTKWPQFSAMGASSAPGSCAGFWTPGMGGTSPLMRHVMFYFMTYKSQHLVPSHTAEVLDGIKI